MKTIQKGGYAMKKRSILRFVRDESGFGINELLGVAAALIIAAFVIIPNLREFADSVMRELDGWWGNNIKSTIFPTGSN
jgi:hypothetical protein